MVDLEIEEKKLICIQGKKNGGHGVFAMFRLWLVASVDLLPNSRKLIKIFIKLT